MTSRLAQVAATDVPCHVTNPIGLSWGFIFIRASLLIVGPGSSDKQMTSRYNRKQRVGQFCLTCVALNQDKIICTHDRYRYRQQYNDVK